MPKNTPNNVLNTRTIPVNYKKRTYNDKNLNVCLNLNHNVFTYHSHMCIYTTEAILQICSLTR